MEVVTVDKKDNPIGLKERESMGRSDIGRVSALWLENSNGETLIAKRARTKRNSPGKWSTAVAGTVEKGEDYDVNIVKETEEEIGLVAPLGDFKKLHKEYISGSQYDFFLQWYSLKKDVPLDELVPQQGEVDELRWIAKSELFDWVAREPDAFVTHMEQYIQPFKGSKST